MLLCSAGDGSDDAYNPTILPPRCRPATTTLPSGGCHLEAAIWRLPSGGCFLENHHACMQRRPLVRYRHGAFVGSGAAHPTGARDPHALGPTRPRQKRRGAKTRESCPQLISRLGVPPQVYILYRSSPRCSPALGPACESSCRCDRTAGPEGPRAHGASFLKVPRSVRTCVHNVNDLNVMYKSYYKRKTIVYVFIP